MIAGDNDMNSNDSNPTDYDDKLARGILHFHIKVLGLVLGLVFGLAIFGATNWLVIKGGDTLGPHLQLLSQYFIGYRVSFIGSLVGFAYGFALGTLSGSLVGWIYNKLIEFKG
jgi:ABC-type dipeptide/oligopeptide/nickel transport system permease subunit